MKTVQMNKYKVKTFCSIDKKDVEIAMRKYTMKHPIRYGFYDFVKDRENNTIGILLYI